MSRELEECDEVVDQMEMESGGKAKQMAVVRSSKQRLKQYRLKLSQLSQSSDRQELLASTTGGSIDAEYPVDVDESDMPSTTAKQRSRLLASQQTLEQSNGRLTNAQRLAEESEGIGATILNSLRSQGEQLRSSAARLDDADTSIGKATKTIKGMLRTKARQRIAYSALAIVLIVVIVLILWSKLR